MTTSGSLDLRLPIGSLFTILGLLVGGYGLTVRGDATALPAWSMNIDLVWGAVMLVFGLILFAVALRAPRPSGVRPASETPEGRATERREHDTGLER